MPNNDFTGPEIVFENVVKEYSNGVKALNNVNFKIEPGEFVFLMGHSGSGKSSLIKLMMLEERPTSGKITIGKDDLSEIRAAKYRTTEEKSVLYFRTSES